ncbi:hypothetical protein LDENG_00255240 [Lucifuga dentata]|nr:hypothetical protein LDENG_00255240 [Lucifuga dentata]
MTGSLRAQRAVPQSQISVLARYVELKARVFTWLDHYGNSCCRHNLVGPGYVQSFSLESTKKRHPFNHLFWKWRHHSFQIPLIWVLELCEIHFRESLETE